MALWILVIISLDICILMHYILKSVKLAASNNVKIVEELQRNKLEIAQVAEEIRKVNHNAGQVL